MYNKYIEDIVGCDTISELDIEGLPKIYREMLLKSYSGDVTILTVKTKERLREIYNNNSVLKVFYTVQSNHKLFYEGFMDAYNNIVKSNGLETYFDNNHEDKIKYIGKKYHRLETQNAYDKVKDLCFNNEKQDGYYSTYDIIIELIDGRYIFIMYEDIDIKNEVIKVSSEVIQNFIDRMIIDKYNIQKGEN